MSIYHDLKEIFHDAGVAGGWLDRHVFEPLDNHFQAGSGEAGKEYLDFINEHGDPMTLFENHHTQDHSHDHNNHVDHCIDHNNY